MWCNKYKKFGSDRWASKNTVQEFVFVHHTGLLLYHYVFIESPALRMFSRWKMKEYLLWTFPYEARLAVIPTCAKRNQQHLGHFPQNKQTNKKNAPSNSPCFWLRGKKLQHSLNSDVTTRRRGIHFETLVLCSFNIHFCICYDLAKSCSDKPCKSAFQKSLAKQKKQALKRSQYTTLLKWTASGQ